MTRTIAIGDVHGCLDELDELLRIVSPTSDDKLVFLGDLVDRGPDPVGVVRRVRELKAPCVLGNHEEKHLRYRRHEQKVKTVPGYRNPMQPFYAERMAEHTALSDADWDWLEKLPVTLDLGDGWIAVHGGFEPCQSFATQRPDKMLRVRYVSPEGKMLPLKSDFDQPGVRWATMWNGHHHVVYGHHCISMGVPTFDQHGAWWRVAADTACVFGGTLTAVLIDGGSMPAHVSVPARRAYASPWAGDHA